MRNVTRFLVGAAALVALAVPLAGGAQPAPAAQAPAVAAGRTAGSPRLVRTTSPASR